MPRLGSLRVAAAQGGRLGRLEGRGRLRGQEGPLDAWHDCLPDFYEVSYNFTHWPEWRSIWRVRGPKKDYTMISDYRR